MPSIIKVDQIQSDQGFVNVSSNLQFSSGFTMLSPTIATPTFTGQATIPTINLTGGQIVFPATQVPSSDGNTLDDYEEGTWTPNLSNSGAGSWSTRGGTYTKIGRLVTCQFNLDGGNSGTAGTTLTLTGLPFTPASYTNTTVGVYGVNDDTSSTAYTGNILINGTTVMFYRGGSSNGNRVSYAGGTLHFYV